MLAALWLQRTEPPPESSPSPQIPSSSLGYPGASPTWMSPGPGSSADEILSSAGRSQVGQGSQPRAEVRAREEM